MSDAKGYYSVIQYCPDPARAEAVNVGVVLLCEKYDYVKARIRRDNQRIERMFGRDSFEPKRLNAAKQSISRKAEKLATHEDLERFIATRGNDMMLTPLRSVRVQGNPDTLLDDLQDELVGQAHREPRAPSIPALDEAMRRPILEGRVKFNQHVEVPLLGTQLKGLYAYQNGAVNLVKPQVFKTHPIEAAGHWGSRGQLLHKHPDPVEGERKLIMVSDIQAPDPPPDLKDKIEKILNDFGVRTVWPEQIEDFAAEVEQEAHE